MPGNTGRESPRRNQSHGIKEINCGAESMTLTESRGDNFWKDNTKDRIITYQTWEGILLISAMQIKMVVGFL